MKMNTILWSLLSLILGIYQYKMKSRELKFLHLAVFESL